MTTTEGHACLVRRQMATGVVTLLIAASAAAQGPSGSPSLGMANSVTAAANATQREWAAAIVSQAREVMRAHLAEGRTQGFPLPQPPLGPATGNPTFPYGWMVFDRGGKYVGLHDVSESTVHQFNLVFQGRATVMSFGGALGAGGKPYGGFANDSKHWIIVPFAYLQSQDNAPSGVKVPPAPGAAVPVAPATTASPMTTATDTVGATSPDIPVAERGRISIGLPLNPMELERRSLYWTDIWLGMSVLYASTDMTKVHGALDNLLDRFLRYENHRNSPEKLALQRRREKCENTTETFARKDCVLGLNGAFAAFGRSVIETRQLLVFAEGLSSWDERNHQVVSKVMGAAPDSTCDLGSVCMRVGPYGAGWNVVCYRLDKPLPQQMTFAMSDDEARALSRRSGDIGDLRVFAFGLGVTAPVSVLPTPRMCGCGPNGSELIR
jgi:hypothetical protein